jgi:hypothetical protein
MLMRCVPPKIRARVVVVGAGEAGRAVMAAELGRSSVPLSLTDLPEAQHQWKRRVQVRHTDARLEYTPTQSHTHLN